MSSQPLVYHWTASFSHQVVLNWMMIMMPMDEIRLLILTMKKSGFSSRQASIWANSGLRKIKMRISLRIEIWYWEFDENPFCPSVRFLICAFCP